MTRDNTSRPRWSVPNRCGRPSAPSKVGGESRPRNDCRTGSSGASHGAATATAATSTTKARPPSVSQDMRRPLTRGRANSVHAGASVGADTGIEEAIHEVDGEVDDDEQERGHEHRALHHWVVAIVDRLHGEPADPRPREHR